MSEKYTLPSIPPHISVYQLKSQPDVPRLVSQLAMLICKYQYITVGELMSLLSTSEFNELMVTEVDDLVYGVAYLLGVGEGVLHPDSDEQPIKDAIMALAKCVAMEAEIRMSKLPPERIQQIRRAMTLGHPSGVYTIQYDKT